ncbi:uncharacterized protein LOC135312194 [Phalacrocorax carbo]|uniref:uncharacterized protein LOC135312194 n=1 Tax=Phalacrocorax carbo TaxID=9209 RepID=UPI00311A2743
MPGVSWQVAGVGGGTPGGGGGAGVVPAAPFLPHAAAVAEGGGSSAGRGELILLAALPPAGGAWPGSGGWARPVSLGCGWRAQSPQCVGASEGSYPRRARVAGPAPRVPCQSSLLTGGVKTHQSSWIFNAFSKIVPYYTKTVPKNVVTHCCLHWRRDKVNPTEGKIILMMMSSLKNNYFKLCRNPGSSRAQTVIGTFPVVEGGNVPLIFPCRSNLANFKVCFRTVPYSTPNIIHFRRIVLHKCNY